MFANISLTLNFLHVLPQNIIQIDDYIAAFSTIWAISGKFSERLGPTRKDVQGGAPNPQLIEMIQTQSLLVLVVDQSQDYRIRTQDLELLDLLKIP